jgi:hypothetical protein
MIESRLETFAHCISPPTLVSSRENHHGSMGQILLHHVVSNRLVERFQLDYVMNL